MNQEFFRFDKCIGNLVTELPYFRGRDKTGFYHVTHEQVADIFSILAVSLISLLRFRIFRIRKGNETGLFQDVEGRDSVLAGRFHVDFRAAVFGKTFRQLPESFGKGREASLLILGTTVEIGNADAGIDPCFVDIKATTVFTKLNKKRYLLQIFAGLAVRRNRVKFGRDKFTGIHYDDQYKSDESSISCGSTGI